MTACTSQELAKELGLTVARISQLKTGGLFDGCFSVINFRGKSKIVNFPDTSMTVYFDIDKFLAVGTDGS